MKKDKLPLVTAVSSFDAVVLCDGDYPSHAVALSILQHAKYLVCCDGAGMHYILHGVTPDAIVGDCDSLPDDFKRRYADLAHLVDEQDDNDHHSQQQPHCSCRHDFFPPIFFGANPLHPVSQDRSPVSKPLTHKTT